MAVKKLVAMLALTLVLVGIFHATDATSSFSNPFILSRRVITPTPNAAAFEPKTITALKTAENVLSPDSSNTHTESQDQSATLPKSAKRADAFEQIWTFDQPEWGVSSDWHMYSDCHHSDVGYTYFTIAYENGTLATDLSNKPALFYIKTSWNIDYQDRLRAAILSDPASLSNNEKVKYDDCFQGHCYSEVIPGVRHRDKPVILKHVENPTIIRHIGRWTNAVCGYSDSVRKVSKNIVSLAQIGYYPFGARIPPAILDFVEAKIKTTYPIVEITLICLFTVGLLPCLIAFSALIWMLVRLARRMDATFTKICGPPKRWHNTVWRGISKAAGWMCNAMFRHGDQTDQMQGSGQGNGQPNIELSDYASTRPPSYKTYASRPGLDLV